MKNYLQFKKRGSCWNLTKVRYLLLAILILFSPSGVKAETNGLQELRATYVSLELSNVSWSS